MSPAAEGRQQLGERLLSLAKRGKKSLAKESFETVQLDGRARQ